MQAMKLVTIIVTSAALLVSSVAFARCNKPDGELGIDLQANDKIIANWKSYNQCLKDRFKKKYSESNMKRYHEQQAEMRALEESINNIANKEKQMLDPLLNTDKYGYDGGGWTSSPPRRDPEQQKNYKSYQEEKRIQVEEAAKRMGLQLD